MNNIQSYGIVKNNAVVFGANLKPIKKTAENTLFDYLKKNSGRMEAEMKKLEMEGRALIENNLPYQLDLDMYKSAKKYSNQTSTPLWSRHIANCFRYGNRNTQPLSEKVVYNVQEFMLKSGKKISEKDINHVVAGYNLEYKHIPVYYDKATEVATVFTAEGKPNCKMKFTTGGFQNNVMQNFEITEVFVPEKGTFVKTKEMLSESEPFFPIEDLLK